MSAKNMDKHNRYRNITVGFRVSPQEADELNKVVALSGLTKQEYCYRRCMERDIVVQGNPKVYKALKINMESILSELKRININSNSELSDELLEIIEMIAVILDGMKGENNE